MSKAVQAENEVGSRLDEVGAELGGVSAGNGLVCGYVLVRNW